MRYTETTDDSAVSPVIGVILMVAITVILAAVIGTFVLGLGENVQTTPTAGVNVDQEANQSLTFTIVDPGNLDDGLVAAPNGNRSALIGDTLNAGVQIEINRGGFNDVQNTSDGDNLVGGEECRIIHGRETIAGFEVDGADIGCSGQTLATQAAAGNLDNVEPDNNQALEGALGSEIDYEIGEYKLIGVINGEQTVVQSVVTREE
jgi:flagellin-like protein